MSASAANAANMKGHEEGQAVSSQTAPRLNINDIVLLIYATAWDKLVHEPSIVKGISPNGFVIKVKGLIDGVTWWEQTRYFKLPISQISTSNGTFLRGDRVTDTQSKQKKRQIAQLFEGGYVVFTNDPSEVDRINNYIKLNPRPSLLDRCRKFLNP
jgi:hypothetical protein